MTENPTDTRLTEIRERVAAATPGPWEPYPKYGPHFVAYQQGEHLRAVGDLDFGVGDSSDADRALVQNAPSDLAVLLAEVERYQAALREIASFCRCTFDEECPSTVARRALGAGQ